MRKEQFQAYVHAGRRAYARMFPYRLVLFDDAECRALVQERHGRAHDRLYRLEQTMNRHYFHRGRMRACIEEVLAGCQACAEMTTSIPEMKEAIITHGPNELVMFDLFTMPYKTEAGYKHVLLVKDHFSKYLWAKALKSKEAGPIASFLKTLFSQDLPCPERWHCDNGSEFINAIMNEVVQELGVNFSQGRPRRPQTQGSIERANSTVKRKLKAWCSEQQPCGPGETVEWIEKLQDIISSENDAAHKLYGFDPFFVYHGRPRMMGNAAAPVSLATTQEIRDHCVKCQEAYAGKFARFPSWWPTFKVGDLVNIRSTHKERKDKKAHTRTRTRTYTHNRPRTSWRALCMWTRIYTRLSAYAMASIMHSDVYTH